MLLLLMRAISRLLRHDFTLRALMPLYFLFRATLMMFRC